jgi:hypothetical protein
VVAPPSFDRFLATSGLAHMCAPSYTIVVSSAVVDDFGRSIQPLERSLWRVFAGLSSALC